MAGLTGVSYWLDALGPVRVHPRRVGRPEVEVVGGGVSGLTCALELALGGVRVRLHEARELVSGASGRNGGFALRGSAAPYDRAVAELGRQHASALWRWTEEGLDLLAARAGDALRRTGSLRLAADEGERAELEREYAALHADGFEAEWVDDLPTHLAGHFSAAIVHPGDAAFQPALAGRRLAALAREAGVELREHSRVTALASLEAERVVVATDGYSSGLLGALERVIVPTRAQMLATEPLPVRLFERPHYARHGYDYWQQLPDGRLVAGGFRDVSLATEYTGEEATTPVIQDRLDAFVRELLGRPVAVTHRWAGIFGSVCDLMPLVGPVPGEERTWVAAGYSGHGNVLAALCGRLVADALLGRPAPQLELFDPARLL